MSVRRHILLFLLKFTVVYTILLTPPFRAMYAGFFVATGNTWFHHVDENGAAVFKEKKSKTNEDVIAEIRLMHKDRLDYATVNCNWHGYLYFAYLIALITATPVGLRRKLFSLTAGLFITYLYMLATFYVLLLRKFDQVEGLHVLHLRGFRKAFVESLSPVIVSNPGTTVFIAMFIYALVIFRRGDWEMMKTAFAVPNRHDEDIRASAARDL